MDIDLHLRRKKLKILSELLRKGWHFWAGIGLVIGYSLILMYSSKEIALVSFTFVLLVALEFEHLRLEYRPKIFKVLDHLFRKEEFYQTSSMISFLLGGLVTFAVFDYWIALTAMMMLIIGDSFAAGFGMMFGKKKLRKKKTYVGTSAALVSNLLTGFVLMHEQPLVFIPMALTATIIELLTNKLDDNLTVPVSTAFVGFLMSLSLTIF